MVAQLSAAMTPVTNAVPTASTTHGPPERVAPKARLLTDRAERPQMSSRARLRLLTTETQQHPDAETDERQGDDPEDGLQQPAQRVVVWSWLRSREAGVIHVAHDALWLEMTTRADLIGECSDIMGRMSAAELPEFPPAPPPPLSEEEMEERVNDSYHLLDEFARTAEPDPLVALMHAVLDEPPTR